MPARPSVDDLAITTPKDGAKIGTRAPGDLLAREPAEGTANPAPGERLWIFLYASGSCVFYFMDRKPTAVAAGRWQISLGLEPSETGSYLLYALVANAHDSERLAGVLATASGRDDRAPGLFQLPSGGRTAYITVICC